MTNEKPLTRLTLTNRYTRRGMVCILEIKGERHEITTHAARGILAREKEVEFVVIEGEDEKLAWILPGGEWTTDPRIAMIEGLI